MILGRNTFLGDNALFMTAQSSHILLSWANIISCLRLGGDATGSTPNRNIIYPSHDPLTTRILITIYSFVLLFMGE